jgi:hypothetical protein
MLCTIVHERGTTTLGWCLGRSYFGRSAECRSKNRQPDVLVRIRPVPTANFVNQVTFRNGMALITS